MKTKRIRTALLTGIALTLAVPVLAEDTTGGTDEGAKKADNQAREIIEKAGQALKDLHGISYAAEVTVSGWVDRFITSSRGTVLLTRESGEAGEKYRLEIEVPDGESSAIHKLTSGCDGELFYLIDAEKKTVYADMDPEVIGQAGKLFRGIMLSSFSEENPFKRELEAETIELRGTSTVDGEECHQVFVKNGPRRESILHISKKDFIIRGTDRTFINPEGESSTAKLVLTRVVANPGFANDPFRLTVPDGFARTDEFAP